MCRGQTEEKNNLKHLSFMFYSSIALQEEGGKEGELPL